MRRWVSLVALAAVLVCSFPGIAPARAPRIKATAERTWTPDFLHLTPGSAAVFKNPTEEPHDIKRYKGPWPRGKVFMFPGDTWKKRFKRTGVYKYRCVLHSEMIDGRCEGMCGVVHVAK